MNGLEWCLLAIIGALAFALFLIDSAYHDLKLREGMLLAALRAERADRAESTLQNWENHR